MPIDPNNPKRRPIPVVPRTMQIVNADGTPTRAGILLLEQLQSADGAAGPPGPPGDAGMADGIIADPSSSHLNFYKAFKRENWEKHGERPSVMDFVIRHSGSQVPIGDGAAHPLSDFYATLTAAQIDYPHAQALTDSLAWAAIQAAIYQSAYVFLPLGTYFVNRPVDVTNRQFGGLHFEGAGQQSQPPAVYTDLVINSSDATRISSAAKPFKVYNRGMVLSITGGTGFTVQQVMILLVDTAGTAICDRVIGDLGSTGGTAESRTSAGSRIIAATSGVLFDCSGSGQLVFSDFYIDGITGITDGTNSTIGFLFGRTYEQPFPESALIYMSRVIVQLRHFVYDGVNVNPTMGGGAYLGSIPIVNYCSETMTIHHCYFQGDRAYIGENQLPMNIVDDYPTTVVDGVTHGQPLKFWVPSSPYGTLWGGDLAVPVSITGVTVSTGLVTFTTLEDLNDPSVYITKDGVTGWFTGAGVTVRGVGGLSFNVNFTFRSITLIDSHTFTVATIASEVITGTYTGGGTAFIMSGFSEGNVSVWNSQFIGQGGPCVTIGGVSMFIGVQIYTLSYHPAINLNLFAAYQIAGQCQGVHLSGTSEQCSRLLYSRYFVYDLRIDIDNPQDPDPGTSRIWMDGQYPDPSGAVLTPGIVDGHIRINPSFGVASHHLIETNDIVGPVACRAVLAPGQDLSIVGGLPNVQIESSENWDPVLPGIGVYDLATHWGRREFGGPVTFNGPLYSRGATVEVNSILGPSTDVQISLVEPTSPITIHTFTDHKLSEGQKVFMLGVSGVTPSTDILGIACHVVDDTTITVPGVSGTGTYVGGGSLRAYGKASFLGLFDADVLTWLLIKAAAGNFLLFDLRVNRVVANFDRDFALVGATGTTYTDLVIGSDNSTCTSAAQPFSSPLSVGQALVITSGTGWTVQTVTVLTVVGNVAHCNAPLGTSGSTGGHAFNPFLTQILGDFIKMEKQAAAPSTLNYLAIDDNGIVLSRIKSDTQTDLNMATLPIALDNATKVTAPSLTSGHLMKWDGTKVVDGGTAGGSAGAALVGVISSGLILTTSFADISGMTVTLTQTGVWLVTICGTMSVVSTDTAPQIQLVFAGSAQTGVILYGNTSNGSYGASGQWLVTSTTGAEVCKAQAKKTAGSGSASSISAFSTISAVWIKP
jgi:hypothetical protein